MMRAKSISILKGLQHPNGLFSAASKEVSTGYDKAWIRDNVYEAIGMEHVDMESALKTYHSIFNILLKHEWKIDWAIMEKPEHKHQYIHARFCPDSLSEFHEDWGNKQNDAIGLFLFKVAELTNKGTQVVRQRHHFIMIQKLVHYLESVEYWADKDNGVWEENEEVHSSSVGACVAALKEVKKSVFKIPIISDDFVNDLEEVHDGHFVKKIHVPEYVISYGQQTLDVLLPRESVTKEVDLAQLSLIYPFNVVSVEQREAILRNVEKHLVKDKGVIRYKDDKYYGSENGEPEWTMGFPWLAKIYGEIGDMKRYHYYMLKTLSVMNAEGELPELYFAKTNNHNSNTPLGWSQALYLVASTPNYRGETDVI